MSNPHTLMPAPNYKIVGPPVGPQTRYIFGAYSRSPVSGVVATPEGIKVGYEDGLEVLFVPVLPTPRVKSNGGQG